MKEALVVATVKDLLLARALRPDGPRRVSLTVRPIRTAYLVHPTDSQFALAAIESACLEWGGVHNFLLPCEPGGSPDPLWLEVLEIYDPDYILDLAGAADVFVTEQHDRWGRVTFRSESPATTMKLTAATVFSSLSRWNRERSQDRRYLTVNLHPLAGHSHALQLAFRLGHLDQRRMSNNQVLSIAYNSARLQNLITVDTVDPAHLAPDEISRLLSSVPLDIQTSQTSILAGITDHLPLPALTHELLPRREPSYTTYTAGSPPELQQYDQSYFTRIVVVGTPDSVPDLCLAWNIRAQRASSTRFPLWVGPDALRVPDMVASINIARGWVEAGLSEPQGSNDLHFVSASIQRAELQRLIPAEIANSIVHDSTDLKCFFNPRFEVGISEDQIVNFRQGVAEVHLPDYWALGDWQSPQWVAQTVAVEGYTVPRGSVEDFGFPPAGQIAVRYAKDGQACRLSVPDSIAGSLWKIGVHNAWDLAQGLAKSAGYSVKVSEKGRLAIAIIQLLGDDRGLQILASSLVYALLRSMAEIIPRQAIQRAAGRQIQGLAQEDASATVEAVLEDVVSGGQFDRQHWERSRINDQLGPHVTSETGDQLIAWLVENRILFQGYVFVCSNCGVRRWYPITRLSERQTCDLCQFVTAKPFSVDRLTWSYRLNEVVGQAVDQGVLPHILALNKLAGLFAPDSSVLAVSPGLDFIPLVGNDAPRIEVDIFAIKSGRVIISECKASHGSITEAEVVRFGDLSRLLACSRVIYAVAADGDVDAALLQRANEVSAPAAVQAWTAPELFDPSPSGRPLVPSEFLNRTVNYFQDPDQS